MEEHRLFKAHFVNVELTVHKILHRTINLQWQLQLHLQIALLTTPDIFLPS